MKENQEDFDTMLLKIEDYAAYMKLNDINIIAHYIAKRAADKEPIENHGALLKYLEVYDDTKRLLRPKEVF